MRSPRRNHSRRMLVLEAYLARRHERPLTESEILQLPDADLWAALPDWWQLSNDAELTELVASLGAGGPRPTSERLAEIEAACRARASAPGAGAQRGDT